MLAASLSGCADNMGDLEETAQGLENGMHAVTPLPSFANTPNIGQAISQLDNPSVVAAASTISGFQIYRCESGPTGPAWTLRTPLAGLEADPDVQRPGLNRARLDALAAAYHYRSDFGALLSPSRVQTLGLAAPPVNAPVWDFTFQSNSGVRHREVLAGRLLAQDSPCPANVPLFLLEIRGRAIDPGLPRILAFATHVLRWNTLGGLAPAAPTCSAATLGQEVQEPYAAEYFFIATAS